MIDLLFRCFSRDRWLTVAQNVGYGLVNRRRPAAAEQKYFALEARACARNERAVSG